MSISRLVLVGGGHSHLGVLRSFAKARERGLSVTLVSPDDALIYSGMLPGVIAGHYAVGEARIPLAPLAAWAGARLVTGRVVALDLASKTVRLASDECIPFDVLSLNVGSETYTGVPGACEHAIPARPFEPLLAAWNTVIGEPAGARMRTLAVVGGGAGGVELVLSMQHRLRAMGKRHLRCALVTDATTLLPGHAPGVGRRLARACSEHGITMHPGRKARRFVRGAIELDDGREVAADVVFLATGASAATWWQASGLGCDERGFISVSTRLQSTTHPFVFAAGDCASRQRDPHPKSGLHAVRQGPVLARNLRNFFAGAPLERFRPPRRWLALIGTGERRAVLSYGALAAEGAWVWRWKQHIDQGHVARYTQPGTRTTAARSGGD